MKVVILLLIACCTILIILAIVNTIRLNSLRRRFKNRKYYTPKLSDLHGKDFADYIDNLL